MRILKYIFIGLIGLLLLALIIGLFLPSQYQLERSITIHAPANLVFEEVNNLKNWQHWSPWKDTDPNATLHYEGPDAGVGCKMIWASDNPKVGSGLQEIVASNPYQYISTRLVFKDWDGTTTANWHFEEQANGNTQVRWSHHSQVGNNILYKYMSSLIMEPMLGKDYERGLQQLKAYMESNQQIQ